MISHGDAAALMKKRRLWPVSPARFDGTSRTSTGRGALLDLKLDRIVVSEGLAGKTDTLKHDPPKVLNAIHVYTKRKGELQRVGIYLSDSITGEERKPEGQTTNYVLSEGRLHCSLYKCKTKMDSPCAWPCRQILSYGSDPASPDMVPIYTCTSVS